MNSGRHLSLFLLWLSPGLLSADTVTWNFDGLTSTLSSNGSLSTPPSSSDFGSAVTVSDLTLDTNRETAGGGVAFQNNRAELGVRENPNPTAYFTITIPAGTTLSLTQLDFTYGFDNNVSTNTLTPLYILTLSSGAATNANGSLPTSSSTTYEESIEVSSVLSGLDNLTDTTVTFTWTFDSSQNRHHAIPNRLHYLDNIVLTGNVSVAGFDFFVKATGDDLDFTWDSQAGKVYDLLNSTDPEADGAPDAWTVVEGQEGIAATPPENTLTLSRPDDSTRLYAVRQRNAPPPPPVFFDDFENAPDPDWTTGANPNDTGTTTWQRGSPAAFVSAGIPPLTGANGSANCFGTNLAADYGADTDIYLRSPAIDLTGEGITSATLTLSHYLDTEIPDNDVGTIRVLRAGDLTQLGTDLASGLNGIPNNNTDWQQFSADLPAAALGETVVLEFQFVSNDTEFYSGWYIDDVTVTAK